MKRMAPSILVASFSVAKLFHKDGIFARHASPIFRWTPYILFGCMWLAPGIVPVLATGLPFPPAADIIPLVGVFALPRMFSPLAAIHLPTPSHPPPPRPHRLLALPPDPPRLPPL